jgi:multiple sugar transport system substrate-binding protein
VKYLASPEAQTKLMELKASLPANKEVLSGPFATSFDGAKVLADAIAYARIKPSFKGYNDWTTALQTELDENVFDAANKTAKQAVTDVLPKLDEILASQ